MEEISDSSVAAVMIPVTKGTSAREKEDNGVETEEELGSWEKPFICTRCPNLGSVVSQQKH